MGLNFHTKKPEEHEEIRTAREEMGTSLVSARLSRKGSHFSRKKIKHSDLLDMETTDPQPKPKAVLKEKVLAKPD